MHPSHRRARGPLVELLSASVEASRDNCRGLEKGEAGYKWNKTRQKHLSLEGSNGVVIGNKTASFAEAEGKLSGGRDAYTLQEGVTSH